ncbi:hypothetical protein AV530_015296 [Patagioenas fasciata monilis]|uniref:Uncharacterized protein n=1 Tax=Patagioenas fasciata monilis TaxID=372326 RepID=A0A1V4K1W3_PATFA|nr:hypothetical protein AV530_015296 [Patagioenas fasciata monilis]
MGAARAMWERGIPVGLRGRRETRDARNLWVRMDPGQNEGHGRRRGSGDTAREVLRAGGACLCRRALLGNRRLPARRFRQNGEEK